MHLIPEKKLKNFGPWNNHSLEHENEHAEHFIFLLGPGLYSSSSSITVTLTRPFPTRGLSFSTLIRGCISGTPGVGMGASSLIGCIVALCVARRLADEDS